MKRLLIISIILFCVLTANAQDMQFGARAGFNFSTWVGSEADDHHFKPGIHFGPYMKVGFTDLLAFQPELLFSIKGYADKDRSVREKLHLYYLDLPLMLAVQPMENFNFLLGLQPSFLIAGKSKVKLSNGNTIGSNDIDGFRNVDLGLIFGFEYALENAFNFGLRFSYGFPTLDSDSDFQAHNANLQLTVGYIFAKK